MLSRFNTPIDANYCVFEKNDRSVIVLCHQMVFSLIGEKSPAQPNTPSLSRSVLFYPILSDRTKVYPYRFSNSCRLHCRSLFHTSSVLLFPYRLLNTSIAHHAAPSSPSNCSQLWLNNHPSSAVLLSTLPIMNPTTLLGTYFLTKSYVFAPLPKKIVLRDPYRPVMVSKTPLCNTLIGDPPTSLILLCRDGLGEFKS